MRKALLLTLLAGCGGVDEYPIEACEMGVSNFANMGRSVVIDPGTFQDVVQFEQPTDWGPCVMAIQVAGYLENNQGIGQGAGFARISWGIGGAQHTADMDLPANITVVGNYARVTVFNTSPAGPVEAQRFNAVGAIIPGSNGYSGSPGATRSFLLGTITPGNSAPVAATPVPQWAKDAMVIYQGATIAAGPATLIFSSGFPVGVLAAVPIAPTDQGQVIRVPQLARTWVVRNDDGLLNLSQVQVIFGLAL